MRVPRPSHSDFRNPRLARHAFLWPAVLAVLALSIFPLIASLGLALSNFSFVRGGFNLEFVGLANFGDVLSSPEYIGVIGPPSLPGWAFLVGGTALVLGAVRRGPKRRVVGLGGIIFRVLGAALVVSFVALVSLTLFGVGGRPGTLVMTFIYVIAGVSLQYLIGLGLAVLTSQGLAGQRFFRVVFLIPLAITPVGVAYMFRMLTDTGRGPFAPLWSAAGLSHFALLADPWGARIAVIISDVWQWIPFMYIVLLAALQGRDLQVEEAAHVDGASRRQIFRHITLPGLVPVSATVILIRMIEAFKIVDLPSIMTNGGPGTATESVTLQALITWRAFDLGQSAAIAYTLLIVVTVVVMAYAAVVLAPAQAKTE